MDSVLAVGIYALVEGVLRLIAPPEVVADGFERHGACTREFSQVESVASAGGSP